jgi:hypothetical protein
MPESQAGMTRATKIAICLKKRRQVQAVQKTWDIDTVLKNNNFYHDSVPKCQKE